MKVLHITNNFPTAKFPIFGIFVKEQIDSLSRLGVENEVFFINGREQGKKAYINGVLNLRKKLKNADYDILHCHHAFSAIILLCSLRFFKYKKIISYQNPYEKEGGKLLYKILYFIFNGIIYKSSSKINTKKKVYYLPNGVDTNFFKPIDERLCLKKLNLNSKNNYILFLDSYKRRKQKRIDRFKEVVKYLQHTDKKLNIEPLILTNTKRSLIPFYMNISSVHVITSDFEGSPNSVKECLACNVKVVSTPVGNVNDMLGGLKGCYVSNSFSIKELAGLVIKSIAIDNFNGRKKLLEMKLDIDSVAHKLHLIYKSLINE